MVYCDIGSSNPLWNIVPDECLEDMLRMLKRLFDRKIIYLKGGMNITIKFLNACFKKWFKLLKWLPNLLAVLIHAVNTSYRGPAVIRCSSVQFETGEVMRGCEEWTWRSQIKFPKAVILWISKWSGGEYTWDKLTKQDKY